MKSRISLLLALCLVLYTPAHAQNAEPDQKALFAGYVNAPVYKAYLENIFNLAEPATLKSGCSALKVVESNRTIILEQPTFVHAGANFNIDTGTWVGIALLDRCGTRVIRRALLKATPGANIIKPTLLLPGDFRGNLKLESDAMRIVTPGLMAFAKCQDWKTFHVLDVKALTPASPEGWRETWTAEACGGQIDGEVTYIATGDGMNISAGKWKAH